MTTKGHAGRRPFSRLLFVSLVTITLLLLLQLRNTRGFAFLSSVYAKHSHSNRRPPNSVCRNSNNCNNLMSAAAAAASSNSKDAATTSSSAAETLSLSSSSTKTTNAATTIKNPVAQRETDRVVWAGKLKTTPSSDDNKDNNNITTIPRQSETSTEPLLDPPKAVSDPYGWMRDESRTNETVLQHLKLENSYTEQVTQHLDPLRQTLYKEMVSALQETDYTTPRPHKEYYYYTRTFQGKSYQVHCRVPKESVVAADDGNLSLQQLAQQWDGSAESPVLPGEQVTLDVNALAEGKPYCATGSVVVSPSHKLLAYATDFSGNEKCHLMVKDLSNAGQLIIDEDLEIYGSLVWGGNDDTLFYLKLDAAQRPYQLYRRRLDSSQVEDELLYEENDELFWTGMYKSLDGKYLFVESSSKETSEIHYLDLEDENATLQCIAKRRPKVLYEVEHRKGQWWIHSNVGGLPNMALFVSPAVSDCQDQWQLVVDSSGGKPLFDGGYEQSLDSVTCFHRHVVAVGRQGGLPRVWILGLEDNDDNDKDNENKNNNVVKSFDMLTFEEDAYDVGLAKHYEFETDTVVVAYDSLVTPPQSIEIDMDDLAQRTVLKEKKVPSYAKQLYGCDRTTVKSRDGTTDIPVSLVYRKDVMEEHMASGKPVHVHLYGYGSYGSCMEADFSSTRLPLLNRGIVYVIAHVRGGGEMGRQWYEEPNGAKYLCKKNTFNDFVDVAKWLINDRKLTTPDLLSCEGRSAGGLLIGASINQAPELFKTAILGVPFVDVVPTMIDASIPLTAVEWEEWGNPNEKKFFDYMMEYSPTQNVKRAKYPSCLLTGGLHDPRVQYWEVSKFAAELRHSQAPESGPVCVKMDMSAGHFSASDRYKYLKELSFDYAFLLDQVGLAGKESSSS